MHFIQTNQSQIYVSDMVQTVTSDETLQASRKFKTKLEHVTRLTDEHFWRVLEAKIISRSDNAWKWNVIACQNAWKKETPLETAEWFKGREHEQCKCTFPL